MDATTSRLAHLDNTNWLIVTIGIIALAVAMGIGRFAFTPLMPLMLRDATLTLVSSAEWAAANYFGYLIGALSAAWFSKNPRCGLKVALIGVTLATLAVAAIGQASPPHIGALLRCAAGLFSAWTLISTSESIQGSSLAMDRISQLDAYLDRYGLTRQRQPLALKHLAGITRKKMTSASFGSDLSTIGLAMRQMLLGSCASPLRMVSGLQSQRALSARAVRWRFE